MKMASLNLEYKPKNTPSLKNKGEQLPDKKINVNGKEV